MQIKSLKFKDFHFGNQWFDEVQHRWLYDDFVADKDWKTGWISFDCALYEPADDRVYLGVTCFNADDIFKAYDRKTGQFVDLGYHRVADPFDAKFHRSLIYFDGRLYGAIALLHDIDNYWNAPGGAIVRYDPAGNQIEKIGIPIPHVYIQSIVLDENRRVIYGQTFTPERLFSFNIDTGEGQDLGPIGSGMEMAQGENICFDDDGNVWGGWGISRAWQSGPGPDSFRLFRYRPD